MKKASAALILAALPALLLSYPDGPEIRRTGAPVDGGQNCSACHNSFGPANSDPRGSVTIEVQNYRPNVRQTIRVTVQHPEAIRWGFQLTARTLNDETKEAGTFTPTDLIRVRCDPDGDAPCNGSREFASHRVASTQENIRGRAVWDVEWTPPGDDAGNIVFYAAGNAAGPPLNTNQGDRIYTTQLLIANEGSCSLSRKPQLNDLVNSASFRPSQALNTLVSVRGLDFQVGGIKRSVTLSDMVDGKFPTTLGCVAVEIAGQRAPILYVQTDLINVQVPTATVAGRLPVRVILNPGFPNELRSDLGTFDFGNYAPALFTLAGTQSVAATFANSNILVANPAVQPTGQPARAGDVITLYGTGFGPTEPVYQAGEVARGVASLRDPYRITIGGTNARAR